MFWKDFLLKLLSLKSPHGGKPPLAPLTDRNKPAVWAATPREAGWIIGKTVFRGFCTFSRTCIFCFLTLSSLILFLLFFSSLTLPTSAFHLSILSEVWLLNFLPTVPWFQEKPHLSKKTCSFDILTDVSWISTCSTSISAKGSLWGAHIVIQCFPCCHIWIWVKIYSIHENNKNVWWQKQPNSVRLWIKTLGPKWYPES